MRPALHFTAPTGWINDPYAISYRDGRYHVFYQYVPDVLVSSPHCHWGHAVSTDLLQFEVLPPALSPGEGDDGVWTGSMAHDDGGSTIFYTSVQTPDVGVGTIRSARPADPQWRSWIKGPVVAEAPAGLDLVAYRDPYVFRDGDGWRMFVGGALAEGAAGILSYSSIDLQSWSYDGIAARRSATITDPVWTGSLWECPQLFEIGGRHVLVSSVWHDDVLHYAAYGVGRYADGRFEADSWGRLTYGPCHYAASFFRDRDGRPSLTFWLRGITDPAAGWIGAHSVPHTLELDGNRLLVEPAAQLAQCRGAPAPQGRVAGHAADVVWEPGPGQTLTVGDGVVGLLAVRVDKRVDGAELVLRLDAGSWTMPYEGGPVRLVVDGPVLELSTRSGLLAGQLQPSGSGLQVAVTGGALQVWPLRMPGA